MTTTKTSSSFYDVTAPLLLDGKLDFENAEVFEGSTVTYTPVKGSSTSKSSAAFSVSKIKAETDLYQIALGATIRFGWDRWSLWLAGGYEWVDAVEFDVGPQRVEIDPSAWTVSAGVACAF